jgi:hypothetical protein
MTVTPLPNEIYMQFMAGCPSPFTLMGLRATAMLVASISRSFDDDNGFERHWYSPAVHVGLFWVRLAGFLPNPLNRACWLQRRKHKLRQKVNFEV